MVILLYIFHIFHSCIAQKRLQRLLLLGRSNQKEQQSESASSEEDETDITVHTPNVKLTQTLLSAPQLVTTSVGREAEQNEAFSLS